jgi:P27 family predicted phage terminase small subunit
VPMNNLRGGRPKPTRLKLLEGDRSKVGRRKLDKRREPEFYRGALPEPPADLSREALKEWHRVAPEVYRLGLLVGADVQAFAAYCQAVGRWMQAERELNKLQDEPYAGLMLETTNGNYVQNPLVGTAGKAMRDMLRAAIEFGLTPAARVRLDGVGTSAPKSKYDGLIAAA